MAVKGDISQISGKDKNIISDKIAAWYAENKRDLPWRRTRDPYKIWISEVILQQTRVDQGMDYYFRFIARFPDVYALAQADEETVLKLWQGLGYYSRARNLHAAAKQVVSQFHGNYPDNYHALLTLKGVGEYTASAVASIAFNEPCAVVDGNVYRVLGRLFAVDTPIDISEGKKLYASLADDLLNKENPGLHNQAMMEFGALQCTPNAPDCTVCTLQPQCMAFDMGRVKDFPVKKRKTAVRNRYFIYFHIEENGHTYVQKRTARDVWKNLYEFPLIETDTPQSLKEIMSKDAFQSLFSEKSNYTFHHKLSLRHVLSHQVIHADFYHVQTDTPLSLSRTREPLLLRIKSKNLSDYPVSRLIHKYLETI